MAALTRDEHKQLVERFVAIADPYEIPAEVLMRWATAQADDFSRWPRRNDMPWKSYVGRTFVAPRLDYADKFYGSLILGNKQMRRPKRKQRPTKREREYAKQR